jgi:hypothetical protein
MAKTINLNFDSMGKDELRSACKAAGVTGYGKLSNLQMRDALKAAYAEPQVGPQDVLTDSAAKSALAKPAAPKRPSKNGISQPAEGTSCRAVWDAIDTLIAQDKKITLEAVRELAGDKMADATIRTQRQRHKTYHGLTA